MTRYLLVLFALLLSASVAKSQSSDTLITYFRYSGGEAKATTADSAQYMRMILPADEGDDRVNVREFDMKGHLIFLGKYDGMFKRKGYPYKTGPCITFYPNGKKKTVINYSLDQKDGDEYFFYPNGRVYYYVKNATISGYNDRIDHLECYDTEGNQVCKAGNGIWLIYNNAYNKVMFTGPVKKGQFDGVWNGRSETRDSIRYNCLFEKGVFKEGKGYDQYGVAHPFTQDLINAQYPDKMITFLRLLRSRLPLPKDAEGKTLSLNGATISFVVEKDGSLTHGTILNNTNEELLSNLNATLAKFKRWVPMQHYGIPFRVKITIPIKEDAGYFDKYNRPSMADVYIRKVEYTEAVLFSD